MDDQMKRVSFYDGPRNKNKILHVETDGCIVNIHVGLTDADGHKVTAVKVIPDDESRGGDGEGRMWHRDGDRIIRDHIAEIPAPDATALLSDCVVGDNTDMMYSDPPLIHSLCGQVLCTVEPGDSVETLASVAAAHACTT